MTSGRRYGTSDRRGLWLRVWQDKTTEALIALTKARARNWKLPGCTRDRLMAETIDGTCVEISISEQRMVLQRPCMPGRYSCSNRKSKQRGNGTPAGGV